MGPRPTFPASTSAARAAFALDDEHAYRDWREDKLARYPRRAEDLIVEVRDPRNLSASETGKIRDVCRVANMAIYASPTAGAADKDIPRRLGQQLGLERLDANPRADEDGVSSLQVVQGKSARGYIPYSNQRMLWHTDGYYNALERPIRAFILHCVQGASQGGANGLLDHEIAYILLRDADPAHVRALSAPRAMTIPANSEEGAAIRAAQSGPVFCVDAETGNLHMRYTARTRSIEWRADEPTAAAVRCLGQLLAADSPHAFTHRLEGGQGLICNNVLHNRAAFATVKEGEPGRLLYRARYHDRIAGTSARAPVRAPIPE